LRNSIPKSELQKRVNLQDESTSAMMKLVQMFFIALIKDYKIKNNVSFDDVPKMSPFVANILKIVTDEKNDVVPISFSDFFASKTVDFASLDKHTWIKCISCGQESASELSSVPAPVELVVQKGVRKSFFCKNCYTLFIERTVNKILSDGSKVEEITGEIEFYGNSVNAGVSHALNIFELDDLYAEDIMLFCKLLCEYIYKDDDKAQKYFIKLFEELSADYSIASLVYLNPNYNYSYPNFQLYA
jgi:hypothetical protein